MCPAASVQEARRRPLSAVPSAKPWRFSGEFPLPMSARVGKREKARFDNGRHTRGGTSAKGNGDSLPPLLWCRVCSHSTLALRWVRRSERPLLWPESDAFRILCIFRVTSRLCGFVRFPVASGGSWGEFGRFLPLLMPGISLLFVFFWLKHIRLHVVQNFTNVRRLQSNVCCLQPEFTHCVVVYN